MVEYKAHSVPGTKCTRFHCRTESFCTVRHSLSHCPKDVPKECQECLFSVSVSVPLPLFQQNTSAKLHQHTSFDTLLIFC